MSTPTTSYVSVDVLALRLDRETGLVMLGLHRRKVKPFLGRLALPGVLLLRGERIRSAAERAMAKTGTTATVATGQVLTFDEPNRDPRGPTLSLALWAVYDTPGADTIEVPLREAPALAFDHSRIVADCLPVLADRLWRDRDLTQSLTGERFTASDAVAIHTALTGASPDRGNLNRSLATTMGLQRTGQVRASRGPGRPAAEWAWTG